MEPIYKLGDRVVARGYNRLIFEVVKVPLFGLNRYLVSPLFQKKELFARLPFEPTEHDIRLATEAEITQAIVRRICDA